MEETPEQISYNPEQLKDLSERFDNLRQKTRSLNLTPLFRDIKERKDFLQNKYNDAEEYATFYAFTVGEFDNGSIKHDDFPGEDSMVKFVEQLEAKYLV